MNSLDAAVKGQHGGDRRSEHTNVDNVNVDRPTGNSRAQGLRRLRTHRPDLHARVLAGELSVHGARVAWSSKRRARRMVSRLTSARCPSSRFD